MGSQRERTGSAGTLWLIWLEKVVDLPQLGGR
jgi:hypothetical protein